MSDESTPKEKTLVHIFEVGGNEQWIVDPAKLPRALELLNAVTEEVRYQLARGRIEHEAAQRRIEVQRADLMQALRGGKLQ